MHYKLTFQKMNIVIPELKNTLNEITCKLGSPAEKISELEKMAIETT